MKTLVKLLIPLLLGFSSLLFGQDQSSMDSSRLDNLKLDGKSFEGKIRATGMIGLFNVRGTLSFKEGLLIWTVDGSAESAPYKISIKDEVLEFTSRVPMESNSYLDWRGTFDGELLSDVTAIWTRADENDLIHNIFLPEVVTFIFKQNKLDK